MQFSIDIHIVNLTQSHVHFTASYIGCVLIEQRKRYPFSYVAHGVLILIEEAQLY